MTTDIEKQIGQLSSRVERIEDKLDRLIRILERDKNTNQPNVAESILDSNKDANKNVSEVKACLNRFEMDAPSKDFELDVNAINSELNRKAKTHLFLSSNKNLKNKIQKINISYTDSIKSLADIERDGNLQKLAYIIDYFYYCWFGEDNKSDFQSKKKEEAK